MSDIENNVTVIINLGSSWAFQLKSWLPWGYGNDTVLINEIIGIGYMPGIIIDDITYYPLIIKTPTGFILKSRRFDYKVNVDDKNLLNILIKSCVSGYI
jgi:hypothetical protein